VGDLEGKVALISGSSRGIGRAIALEFARQGARCVLCARSPDVLHAVADQAASSGAEAAYIELDLREPDAPEKLVDFTIRRFGALDIVVNNAGATTRAPFLDLTEHDWTDGFALKFFGAVRLSRAAWPHLKKARGSVLNIAGAGGRTPGAAFAVGGSVNAALLSFTKSLAETGIADGVQVNAINPGAVRTGRLDKRLQDLASARQTDLASAERDFVFAERITRVGEPQDIAGLAAFVAGPRGRFLHGALIDMDGGATKTI
jgi:NAD(P)-dependent dehydrogenase (short-subunit alcohol dehydrogenase family)